MAQSTEQFFSTTRPEPQRYYKVQMKAWTTSDPSKMDLRELVEHIERGTGILTVIEVVKVADDLNGVDDVEVREQFENVRAVERIVRNIDGLPKSLRERLHAALAAESSERTTRTIAA